MNPLEVILSKVKGVKGANGQWTANCPAHEDSRSSLSIGDGGDKGVLLHCHAGCETGAIVGALGMSMANLFPPKPKPSARRGISKMYDYQDETGELLFQVCRLEDRKPKPLPNDNKCFQRRPDDKGGWINKLGDVRRVLYRLPVLLEADPAETVYVTEGEKDVDRLHSLGLTATCNPGGALKWKRVEDTPLHGRHIALIGDNDKAGRDHVADVARRLHGKVASLKVVELPDLPDKGDVSDWLDAVGSLEQLKKLVADAPEYSIVEDESKAHEPAKRNKPSQADLLVESALKSSALFHTPGDDGEAFVTLDTDGIRQTHKVNSKRFKRWLSYRFFKVNKKTPHNDAIQNAINVLSGKALFEGPEFETAVRIANHEGAIYLDLCNDEWQAVEITHSGWHVIDSSEVPVRFIRRRGMLAIPVPVSGGSVDELRTLVNIPDDDDWFLYVSFLVAALRPAGPYPILKVIGEQGSAKSTACRFARQLIDPNRALLRRPPKDERDIMIAASNGWIVGFDNISSIPLWLSDCLCCLSTGGGFGTRELYSDDEEKLFEAKRPIIMNGIEDFAIRSDPSDRAIRLVFPMIPDEERRDENEDLIPAFNEARPRILGALLDAVSAALANIPSVKLPKGTRMMDFAKWATAAEPAFGWNQGSFLAAYTGNRKTTHGLVLESDLIGPPMLALMTEQTRWEGTMTELLRELEAHASENVKKQKDWPHSPRGLRGKLDRIAPNLRAMGIDVRHSGHTRSGSHVTLEQTGKSSSQRSQPSHDALEGTQNQIRGDGQ